MVHAKSVSWHHVSNDYNDLSSPSRARTTSMSEHHQTHRTLTSPSKSRYRGRSLISPTPIGTSPNRFTFPSTNGTGSQSRGSSITSPTWEVGDSFRTLTPISPEEGSPYILNSQPSLQDIFITLANKERRVLEAKEQLLNAETELAVFRCRWSSILNVKMDAMRRLVLLPRTIALGLNTLTYRRLAAEEYLNLAVVENDIDPDMAVPCFEEKQEGGEGEERGEQVFERIVEYYRHTVETFFNDVGKDKNEERPVLVKPYYPSVIQVYYQAVKSGGI